MLIAAKHLLCVVEDEKGRFFAEFTLSEKQIPRGVYPERSERARNDSRETQDDAVRGFISNRVGIESRSRDDR